MVISVHVEKSVHFLHEDIRGFIIGNVHQFLNGVDGIVIGVDGYADVALMFSAVQVAVNRKIHIAVISNLKDPYIMTVIDISHVKGTEIIEAVHIDKFCRFLVIQEKPSAGYKAEATSVGTFHHLRIFSGDTQDDLIIDTHVIWIGDLFHGPYIGHDIHTLIRVSYGYGFMCHVCGEGTSVSAP